METIPYGGYDCVVLENQLMRVLITQSVGPRVLFCGFRGGENLFAELPDFTAECPGAGEFRFRGGHRLWRAPEDEILTYLPDDSPVEVFPAQDGARFVQPTESQTGLQKSIEIRLHGDFPRAEVLHRLTNFGSREVVCAPWAITQLRPGGVALLPQSRQKTGLLPNRCLALWEYADMSDPNLTWGAEFILATARMTAPFKVGFPNPRGWLAYWLDGTLFVKRARYEPQAAYGDFGSSSECYCNSRFLELETLAPIQTLPPGGSASHLEIWELYSGVERPDGEAGARALAEKLALDSFSM